MLPRANLPLLGVDEGDVFQGLPWREVWAHESNGFYVLVLPPAEWQATDVWPRHLPS
jgi:hypothetical protein